MYALTVAAKDEQLQWIKLAKTPKEAWDNIATAFAKKNEAYLKLLENELFLILKWNFIVSQ